MQKKHVVVVGDSNIVGTPLSVLLRDAGAGTVTVCHRIAYNNLFSDRAAPRMGPQLRADACLPRLPGPYSPEKDSQEGASPWFATGLTGLRDDAPANSSGGAYGLGGDSDRATQQEVSVLTPHHRVVIAAVC